MAKTRALEKEKKSGAGLAARPRSNSRPNPPLDKAGRAGVAKRVARIVLVPQDDPAKFERHLDRRKPPTGFRFRPSVANSSLLARRSRSNAAQLAASASGSLVPTNNNFVDLVTPPPPRSPKHPSPAAQLMDSGYFSGPNKTASPPPPAYSPQKAPYSGASSASSSSNSSSSSSIGNSSSSSSQPQVAPAALHPASGAGIVGHSVPDYCATMEQATERIFFQKYVAKEFTHNAGRAREQLAPVMRKALDKMEDRPMVDRFVLHLDFARRTIRGEHVRQRLRKLPGQRAVDRLVQSWESKDYMHAR